MDEACTDPLGGIWVLHKDLTAQALVSNMCIFNSLVWRPDGATMILHGTSSGGSPVT
jgi:sugar lactone lactonase YvrE